MRASLEELALCASVTCPAIVRDDCISWLDQVREQMPTVAVRARDLRGRDVAGVRVFVDETLRSRRLEGVAIRLGKGFSGIAVESGHRVRAGAGAPDVKVARAAVPWRNI